MGRPLPGSRLGAKTVGSRLFLSGRGGGDRSVYNEYASVAGPRRVPSPRTFTTNTLRPLANVSTSPVFNS